MGNYMEAGLTSLSSVIIFLESNTGTGVGKVFDTYLLKNE